MILRTGLASPGQAKGSKGDADTSIKEVESLLPTGLFRSGLKTSLQGRHYHPRLVRDLKLREAGDGLRPTSKQTAERARDQAHLPTLWSLPTMLRSLPSGKRQQLLLGRCPIARTVGQSQSRPSSPPSVFAKGQGGGPGASPSL